MTNQRNVRNLILGKTASVGTGVPAVDTQVEPSNMADGTVVITATNGKRVSTLSGVSEFCVVQGQGPDKPLIKNTIKAANITSISSKPFVAANEQVSYIGYTGSTGSLPVGGVDTTYYGAVVLQGEFLTFGAREMKKTFDYKCTTSDSTADVAAGLALSIYNGVAKMADPYYKVERVSSADTFTATTGTATHLKFSKGSKTVSFVTAAGAASTGSGVAVGDAINVPSTNGSVFTFTAPSSTSGTLSIYIGSTLYTLTMSTDAATNAAALSASTSSINTGNLAVCTSSSTTVTITLLPTTKPTTVSVYNATTSAAVAVTIATGSNVPVKYIATSAASSSASFTLDLPWAGESCIVARGTTGASMVNVATLSSGTLAWGLKLTGQPRTYSDITFRFYKIRFAVELFNMGSTTSTLSVAASEGSGMSEAIQWMESFMVGNEGAYYVIQPEMPLARRKNSLNYLGTSQGWNLITINYYDATTNNIIGGQKMEKSLTIAGATGTSTAFTGSGGVIPVLETLTVNGTNPDLFPSGSAWV
jgi:hypothetical protein